LVRLVAISVPIAAVVLYFGMLGRPPSRPAAPAEIAPPAAQSAPAPATVDTHPAVPAAAPVPADRLMVQVLATRTSWIAAIVDGRRVVQRMFQPGEEQTFEVHKEIVLTTGDAGGVAVVFNGTPTKPLGASGQVVTTRVNLTNFKDYLLTP
jgi:hypothetical protein